MRIEDLGTLGYRDAWAVQERVHAEVLEGAEGKLLLVEHPPVITLGRRPGREANVIAGPERLAQLGVELVQSDRGGDVTFHGPGQLVAYPIVKLNDYGLSVGKYVKTLEQAVIDALREWGIDSSLDPDAVGVWTADGGRLAKICALGVRINRGVSMHGIALNVTTDLRWFELINPCGLGRPVTSIQRLLGPAKTPGMDQVKSVVARNIAERFPGRP
jgi:lipoyl(octanoyl) transferase